MSAGFETLEGWYSSHDFREFDWAGWKALSSKEQDIILEELFGLFNQWRSFESKHAGAFELFDVVGNKGDLLMFNLRPTIDELIEVKHAFNQTRFAALTIARDSFSSVIELSNYVVKSNQRMADEAFVQSRLRPKLPAVRYLCFYPMNKKREGADNWYSLPVEERQNLMRAHGMTGMKFKGQVTQMICGSIGLDDWEWGVTLFADDPLVFKKVVTEMRFDEVSARFAEFGPFYVGRKVSNQDMVKLLRKD